MIPHHHRHLAGVLAGAFTFAVLPAQSSDHAHAAHNVFAQLPWFELGPVQSGGRIVDLAVHPQRSHEFWLAAASGGIWHTQNGGLSFTPQFQDAASISIGDLAVAPSDGNVLYVGTGEANNQRSSYWGNGVHKSVDGGKTWQHVGLAGTDHIGRIVVHPTDPDVVYVAALGALYTPNDERGLYRTADGGKTWTRVHHLGPDVGCVDVALDPKQPATVFAASYERRRRAHHFKEGGQGSRLWKSTDAGQSWVPLQGGLPQGVLGRIGLDVFADGQTIYATIENLNPRPPRSVAESVDPAAAADTMAAAAPWQPSGELLADAVGLAVATAAVEAAQDPARVGRRTTIGGEVWRSDDGGTTWRKPHGDEVRVGGDPGYYYGQIRIDPNTRDTVYVLSVPVHKSTDGGKTWTPSRTERSGFADSLHVDHHALWIDPADSRHCLLGNDGGLAVTWDGGATWDHLTHLPILQFYTVAADLRSPYRVYGGLQDNGTWGFPLRGPTSAGLRPTDAYRIDGGDGFYVCIDPTDPDVVYSESQFGGMSRQHLRTGERKSIKPRASKGQQPLRFNWNTPIVLSPHAPHTVYVGSQHLHRSTDRGDHWVTISPDLSTNDADKKQGNVPHCTITTIAESPQQAGWLWVGTDDGKVWTSKDGGQQWQDHSDRFPAAVRGLWVSRVEASPHAAATVFVAFTGYREDRRAPFVFRTDDGGDTWLPIAHDLPQDEPVNVVRQHPRAANVLLVGTEMGAYVSNDDGAHWHRLGRGLPRVAVHDLIVHAREEHVLVGTHGRGIWVLDGAALPQLSPERLGAAFQALPPSDGHLPRRAFGEGSVGARSWSLPNVFTAPAFRYLLGQDDERTVKLEVLDATGTVLWSKDGPTTAGYHEVVWQGDRRGPGGRGGPGGLPLSGGSGTDRARPAAGPRAGTFVIRTTSGSDVSVQPFTVHDHRNGEAGPRPADDDEAAAPGDGEADAAAPAAAGHRGTR